MKKTLIVTAVVGVLGAVAVAAVISRHGAAASTSAYRFTTVSRGDVASTVNATGTLGAVRTVQVGTQVSGQISELHADFNDRVRRGQLIARLDSTLLQLAVQSATSDVQKATADVEQKQYLLNQNQRLAAANLIADADLRTSQYNVTVSLATQSSANDNLARARQNLRYAAIYSPIDGVVIERDVDVGQTVAASLSAPQLFLIATDLKHMQILASVDESDIGQIHVGQPTHFTVQAYPNRTFAGTVEQVRMQSKNSENVVSYTVVIAVGNADNVLLPGMTATVTFEVASATDVFLVPNAALRIRPTPAMLASVQAPGRDSTARRAGRDSSAAAARPAGRDTTVRTGARTGAGRDSTVRSSARLWTMDSTGTVKALRVHVGITNGQETEVSGAGLHEGLKVISGLATGTAGAAAGTPTTNPLTPTRQQGGRGGPGGL